MNAKPAKMKAYESFTDWKKDQSTRNQELISALQVLIEETAHNLNTTAKWGQGCWVKGDTPKVYIHTEEDHVQLGFYNGSSLEDPSQLLSGNGKYVRYVRVGGVEDIDTEKLTSLISQAVQ
jgi:hypothetical protein